MARGGALARVVGAPRGCDKQEKRSADHASDVGFEWQDFVQEFVQEFVHVKLQEFRT